MGHATTFPPYVEVNPILSRVCSNLPIHCHHDLVQTIKTSVHGAINMLRWAERVKLRVFQVSTSEVYGDPVELPNPKANGARHPCRPLLLLWRG